MKIIQFFKVKKYRIIGITIICLLTYLLAIDYILKNITIEGEARQIHITNVNEKIKFSYGIDFFELNKLGWKTVIFTQGWTELENPIDNSTKIILSLVSTENHYEFDLSTMSRRDVQEKFGDNRYAYGFRGNIPLDKIKDNQYKLAIIVKTSEKTYSVKTEGSGTISNGKLSGNFVSSGKSISW